MSRYVFPVGKPATGRAGGSKSLNTLTYSYMIAAMLEKACTREDLKDVAGVGPALIARCIRDLRARGQQGGFNSVLHIEAWRLDKRGYPTLAAFRLGPGLDMAQPKKSRTQVVRDYLERKAKRMTRGPRTTSTGAKRELPHPRIDRMLATGG